MNDDFLYGFRQKPRLEFGEALYERISRADGHMNGVVNAKAPNNPPTSIPAPALQSSSPLMLVAVLLVVALFGALVIASFRADRSLPVSTQIEHSPLEDLAPISIANAAQLSVVQQLGRGVVYDVAWSPDGKIVALAGPLGVWLQDTDDYAAEPSLLAADDSIFSLAFSPAGTHLAGSSDRAIHLWDLRTGALQAVLEAESRGGGLPLRSGDIAFSADTALLARAAGQQIEIWDAATGERQPPPEAFPGAVTHVVFSPDGRLAATGSCVEGAEVNSDGLCPNAEVILWDTETIKRLETPVSNLSALAFSPDGTTLVAVGIGSVIYIWDVSNALDRGVEIDAQTVQDGQPITDLSFSPDGRTIAVVGFRGEVRLWDVESLQSNVTLPFANRIGHVAFSPDGSQLIAADFDTGAVEIWDITLQESIASLAGYHSSISDLALSSDNRLLAMSTYEQIDLWEVETARAATLELPEQPVAFPDVAFSADGTTLAHNAEGRAVTVMNLETQQQQHIIIDGLERNTRIELLHYSTDGELLAQAPYLSAETETRGAAVWRVLDDVATPQNILEAGERLRGRAAFSPDGTLLAVAGEANDVVWLQNLETGETLGTLKLALEFVTALAFSPDSQQLAVANVGQTVPEGSILQLFDVGTGREQFRLFTPDLFVAQTVFSPDGAILAHAGSSGVTLWDVEAGRELVRLAGETSSMTFSVDGTLLVTGSQQGVMRLWGVEE